MSGGLTRTRTRSGRGRNYCPILDEILIDRADAYRLHKREKEASNYLRRSHERLPGEHLAGSGLLWSWRLTGFGSEDSAIRKTNPSSCVGVRLLIPQKLVDSERLSRDGRARTPLVACQTTPSSLPVFPLGRPSYRNLLVVHSRHSSGESVCLFQCAVQVCVSHSLSTRHAASISSILKTLTRDGLFLSCAQRRTAAKGLQSIIVVSLRGSTPHPY
jgi:hypothetical protein